MAAAKKRKAAELVVEMAGGIAKLTTDMGKANQLIGNFGKEVQKTGTILKAMFAFDIIKTIGPQLLQLSGTLNRLADEGEKVGSIREAFEGLGGSSGSIKKAQDAVIGMVSAFDLMGVANQGLIRGIPQFTEKFEDLAKFAGRFANATGRDTLEVLNELTEALAKGKAKGLEPFGFALDKNASKAENQAAVYAQLENATERLAAVTDSVSNAHIALGVKLNDVYRQIGIGVNTSEALTLAYRDLGKEIDRADWEGFGGAVGDIAAAFVDLGSIVLPPVASLLSDIAETMKYITGRSSGLVAAGKIAEEIKDLEDQLKNGRGVGSVFSDVAKSYIKSGIPLPIDTLKRAWNGTDSKEQIQARINELQKQFDAEIAGALKVEEERGKKKEELGKKIQEREARFQADRDRIEAESDAKRIHQNEMAELDAYMRQRAKELADDQEKRKREQEQAKKDAEERRRLMVQSTDELFSGLGDFSRQLGLDLTAAFETAIKFLSDESKAAIGEWATALTGLSGSKMAAYLQAGGTVADALMNARRTDKANKDNSGTGAAVGAGGGGIIGAIFGGPAGAAIGAEAGNIIGGLIGSAFKWGSQNPETNARHAFANFVEEGFKKLGQVSFFDSSGQLQNIAGNKFNFLEGGSGRFNNPDWGASMDSWGDKAKQTFLGLGEALKEVQGITEDVGGQIAFLLGENLSGNIDNARLFVQQLGLSFEDLGAALEASAKRGSISWHEFEVNLQGVSEAFKPGLEAFGDVAGAVNEIYDSGGRGQAALKGIRDLAQEVKDLGGSTIGDLQKFMEAQGVSADRIKTIIDSLQARGVTSIDQLLGLDDRGAGGIIAEMYSQSEELAAQWDKMGESLKGITDTLKEMDEQLEKELTINVKANLDSQTQDLLNAGVFDGTGLETAVQQMKAAGSINIGSVGSLSGVSTSQMASRQFSPTTINVDARGAAPGVSAEITNALSSLEQRVVQSAIRAIYDARARGE